MTSDYIFKGELEHLLAALTPENRLACEVSLATGLRIGDVLAIKTAAIGPKMSVQEAKTGKRRTISLSRDLRDRMALQAGSVFVWPNRLDGRRHRTRQAVYKDLLRVRQIFRVKEQLSPHTCRKVYAVEQYHKTGDLKRVQQLLNHSSEAVTQLYALADVLTARRMGGKL